MFDNGLLEFSTGASDDFKKYNIYDMAGNLWEWTTSHNINNNQMYVVPRGGGFDNYGTNTPFVQANGCDDLTTCILNLGFRIVLYIS